MKPYHHTGTPLEAQYLYRRGMEMMDQQKEDSALVYLRQAVFIAPGFSKAYRELGNCLTRLGRPNEASAYRMKASRIDPIPCDVSADGITMKGKVKDPAVPGQCLTFLIW
jgi:tetratricopeptide (TPR) repeat protein